MQIRPGRIYSLTVNIISSVKHFIKDLDAKMRHTDLIDIRETHGKTDIDLGGILLYHVQFIADVSCRLIELH